MELPTTIASWYATAMSLLISSILLGLSIYHFLRVFDSVIKFLILKYLIYPSISLLKPAGIRLNYLDVGIALLFLCANGTCLAWRTESVDDLSSRSASLLVTNCILLLPGASITADGLRISLETHRKAHVAVGTISFLQCLVHVVIELAVRSWPGNARSLWGVVAATSILSIGLFSLPQVKRRVYELFITLHYCLTALLYVSLWFHVPKPQKRGRIQVYVGTGVFAVTLIHRVLLLIYRNLSWSKSWTIIKMKNFSGVIKASVAVPRPWKFRPGQYVFLTIPNAGLFSAFQRHPFMITRTEAKNGTLIELRIQPQDGFTKKLLSLASEENSHEEQWCHGWIEGPYGVPFRFNEFGTVVMFANSIGIAGHLGYIQELIKDYREFRSKTRDILIVWYTEHDGLLGLVQEFMNDLLREDKPWGAKGTRELGPITDDMSFRPGERPKPSGENILDIFIYHSGEAQVRSGERIAMIPGSPNVAEIVDDVIRTSKGRVAISVCATPKMRNEVQETVIKAMDKSVQLIIPDFQPSDMIQTRSVRQRSLSVQCRGREIA